MLVPYDPRWPRQFRQAAARINHSGNPDWLIEHIGSTAIPGMPAKPIIDLAVRIDGPADFLRHRRGLEAAGWRIGSSIKTHPVMLLDPNGQRTHIAHFFDRTTWDSNNQRLLRDWLLTHPEDAAEYAEAKRTAEHDSVLGRATYNAAKTAVIQRIVDRARTARGLPLAPVQDK